jgi:hypothetical protein
VSPTPSTPPPAPKKGAGAGAWIKGHKPEAALGGAGIAVTLFLAYRARKANAAAGASSSSTPASTAVPVSTADTTSSDAFSGLESQVVGLQSALLGLQGGGASGSGGSQTAGSSFIPLSAAEAHNIQLSDPAENVFYESAPGVFSSVPVSSFSPWSTWGTAYLQAPTGYTAPQGAPAAVSGVVGPHS